MEPERLERLRDLRTWLARRNMPKGTGADLDRAIAQRIAECRRAGIVYVEVPGDGVLFLGGREDVWYPHLTAADIGLT